MVDRKNHVLTLLTISIFVFLIGYILEFFKVGNSLLRDYFQISTEILPLVLSFSIFITTCQVYKTSHNDHSIFLGWAFFIIGIIDLYHILSYPFMPAFITTNTSHKSDVFWAEGRLLTSVLFLASVYIYNGTIPKLKDKIVLFASLSVIIISFLSLTTGIYPQYFPSIRNPDGTPTQYKIFLLLVSSAFIISACYLYIKRQHDTKEKNLICLIYGFVLVIASNLTYLYFDYPGHLLKAAGFYFLYLSLFKESVELPYLNIIQHGEMYCKEIEERFRNVFDNASDAIIITDIENIIISANKSAERIFGLVETEIIGKEFIALAFDEKLKIENQGIIRNTLSGNQVSEIETVITCKDGTKKYVSMNVSPLRGPDQKVIGLSSIIRDITERKNAEEQIKADLNEKEVLLREIHHRVKNNMQIISSLLRLQSASIKDKKYSDMYLESQNRIITMSLIHEKLYQSKNLTKIDVRDYTRDLVNGIVDSYGINTSKICFNFNVENVFLGINSAIPCGLIINELVSNSLKYAFPGGKSGEIKIILRTDDYSNFELKVSDTGIGIPNEIDIGKTETMGLRLVRILAENQLHGKVALNRANGTEFQINFQDVN
jgi:PAS domain S-box-containing protein